MHGERSPIHRFPVFVLDIRAVAMKLGVAAADEVADTAAHTREAALTIFIALLILLWLVVCIATVALCRAAATADRLDAERNETRTGPRMSPRSVPATRDE